MRMWRRPLLAIVAGSLAVVGSAEASAAVPRQQATYTNPVLGGSTVNPSVLRAGDGAYYAYVNGFDYFIPVPVMAFRSTDLATWTQVGNVLPPENAGGWLDSSSGRNFTSPSVLHVPTNPDAQRYVLYFSAKRANSTATCIGIATAAAPTGPFVGAAQPLICPSGGARDPSALPSAATPLYQQLVYRHNGTDAGIYNQLLTADGLSLHPNNPTPFLLQKAQPTWWHQGVVERPTVAWHGDVPYLLFSGGAANTAARAIGWARCNQAWGILNGCPNPTHLGQLIAATDQVESPSGPQVFSDGANLWLAYDGLPAGSCPGTGPCGGTRSGRIDKLCFRNDHPRTNAPSATSQPRARNGTSCSTDVPGAPLSIASITDNGTTVPRPGPIAHRDGGGSGVVDGRLIRTYADTLVLGGSPPIVTNTGSVGVPAAAATGPHWATETVDAGGRPVQLIPFTAEEAQFNRDHWCPPSQGGSCDGKRVALWPAAPVPTGQTNTVFFLKLIHDTDCGTLCYENVQVGAVRVDVAGGRPVVDRSPTAAPVGCNPTCLFDSSVVARSAPFILPMAADGYLYLYGRSSSVGGFDVLGAKLARAPASQVDDRAAWRFWTGSSWSQNPAAASDIPNKWSYAAVDYVPYLDRYVSVGEHFLVEPNRFYLQTAPEPTGPWTPIDRASPLFQARSCPDHTAYSVNHHAALATQGGRLLALSYARPGPDWGRDPNCPGQERYVTVRLR